MNLKELFSKAENGVLSYDEFIALAKESNSKFVDLSDGGYVDKQKYADDIGARDTRIKELDATIATRDNDLATLRQHLETAGTDATKLAELTTQFTDLQKQYDRDTKAYQKQLQEQAYKHAVAEFVGTYKFSSNAARRDFERALLDKNLQLENDTIIGASDFVSAYTKDNADAFLVDNNVPPVSKPQPHFVEPSSPTQAPQGESSPFKFNFTGVRPHDN